ncbi:MFS transporter [Nocardioides nanhaiensis]|uniref:MFS transporter n=1 Tax=Nocardioides nanhaiensis TaxID=1476871 RepID=A0ABP8W3C2_9ACTN
MRERRVLLTLALVTTVTAVVSSLGAPLVPAVAARYEVAVASAQWALTATLLAGAVATPVVGRLGNGRLRRPVVLGGLATVLAGCVLAALPLGFGALVAGRALQGVGLALVPLALAAARDTWRGDRLPRVLGLLSVTTVAGAGVGYPVTALVAEHLGLAGAYWFGAALVAITLILAVLDLPVARDSAVQPVDVPGALLLSLGMTAALLAVSQGDAWGWLAPVTLGLLAVGAALLAGWVRRTLRTGHPLVDLRLARRPGVVGPHLVAMALGASMYALLTLVVVVVQAEPGTGATSGDDGYGLGLGIAAAGLVLVPYSVASVAGNQVARRVARRLGPGVVLPVGCAAFAVALGQVALSHQRLWQVLVAMALGGLGSGFTFSSIPALLVPHVPRTETASALAFNQLMRYLGFSVGSALSVALLVALGDDDAALRATLGSFALLCLAAGLVNGATAARSRRA